MYQKFIEQVLAFLFWASECKIPNKIGMIYENKIRQISSAVRLVKNFCSKQFSATVDSYAMPSAHVYIWRATPALALYIVFVPVAGPHEVDAGRGLRAFKKSRGREIFAFAPLSW